MTNTGKASAQKLSLSTDVAVTYVAERSKVEPSNCGCFWLNGGSVDAAVTAYKGLGVAFNLTGETNSNIAPGVSLTQIEYMGGLRYTHALLPTPRTRLFLEGLSGAVHAYNGTFPQGTQIVTSVNKLAVQAGGGVDVALKYGVGVRVEGDWVYTQLPNAGTNTQNDFKIAAGLSYHFGK